MGAAEERDVINVLIRGETPVRGRRCHTSRRSSLVSRGRFLPYLGSYGYWIACTSLHYQLQKLSNLIWWGWEAWNT